MTILFAGAVFMNSHWMKLACFFLMYRYLMKTSNLRWMNWGKIQRQRHKLYLIESSSPNHCYSMFQFKKQYLFTGWGVCTLTERVPLEQRSLYHREMMFLLLLDRYAHAGTFQTLSEKGWGDVSVFCRAFNRASTFLFNYWEGLIRNDLSRAADKFKESCKRALAPLHQPLPRDAEHLALIVDGTRKDIGKPVDADVEDCAYRAYTASHCLGYLSLIGFPFPGRDPDGVYVNYGMSIGRLF